jgi:hypothetical protein
MIEQYANQFFYNLVLLNTYAYFFSFILIKKILWHYLAAFRIYKTHPNQYSRIE